MQAGPVSLSMQTLTAQDSQPLCSGLRMLFSGRETLKSRTERWIWCCIRQILSTHRRTAYCHEDEETKWLNKSALMDDTLTWVLVWRAAFFRPSRFHTNR